MPPLVLVVEDEKILGDSIAVYLEHSGASVTVARSGEDGIQIAAEHTPDVAIVDIRLPGMDGLEVLRRVRDASPGTEVVIMTGHATITSAVEAMKRGAFDYLSKPVDLEGLRLVVEKALGHQRLQRQVAYLRARDDENRSAIVGESLPIQALREQVTRVARLESPDAGGPTVLIRGETGVGKELVARAIHAESPRGSGPFVEVNCAAIPATLLEAELFGYERGAYTDARAAKPGLFEAADGGTLFLDEIGHMDPALQVKLLKAIEEKSVRRVGGLRARTVNVRIVAATNRDLEGAIAAGAFRADLYYRLNVLVIEVPPLRARDGDIVILARHFLERCARRYGLPVRALTSDAETRLLRYAWPGNVRELAHVMERAALLKTGPTVTVDDLGFPADAPAAVQSVSVTAAGGIQVDFSAGGIVLDDVERRLLWEALRAVEWNRTRAAQLLGISRDTLRYRIEKHGLRPPATTEDETGAG